MQDIDNAKATEKALYGVLAAIRARCYSPTAKDYHLYGGRGVVICDDWLASFDEFTRWAMANGYAPGKVLSRRDKGGPYSPENCVFNTRKDSQRNRGDAHRLPDGRSVAAVAEQYGIEPNMLKYRIKTGWPLDEAIALPAGARQSAAGPASGAKSVRGLRLDDGRSVAKVAAENKVARSTWYHRWERLGWSLEHAVTVPAGGVRPADPASARDLKGGAP